MELEELCQAPSRATKKCGTPNPFKFKTHHMGFVVYRRSKSNMKLFYMF